MYLFIRFSSLFCFLCFCAVARGADVEIGILGDSLALGAASHPAFAYDAKTVGVLLAGQTHFDIDPKQPLLQKYNQKQDGFTPPQVLWKGPREHDGPALSWVFSNFLDALGHGYINTPEYSWGYLVSKGLGAAPQRVAIAGDYGAKMASLPRQVDRLLDFNKGKLPHKVFILFTGNDLCGISLAGVTTSKEFARGLEVGLRYLVRNGETGSAGTDVYVLSYLDVGQLITKPSILNQKVRAYGEDMSCKDMRARAWHNEGLKAHPQELETHEAQEAAFLHNFFPANPATVCPTLFAHELLAEREVSWLSRFRPLQKEREFRQRLEDLLSNVAGRVRQYQAEEERILAEVQSWREKREPAKNVRFHLIKTTADVSFEGDDMAADCFHLNLKGHDKIAQAVLRALGH